MGDNTFGQISNLGEYSKTPSRIQIDDDIIDITAGESHSICISKNGSVWSFGLSDKGQNGIEISDVNKLPRKIDLDDKIIKAACGKKHSLLLNGRNFIIVFCNKI